MAQNNTKFSNEAWQKLSDKLDILGSVCRPPADLIKPSFRFKFITKDNEESMQCQLLECLYPPQLKSISVDNKELLDALEIDYIKVKNKNWFFYKYDKIGRFFLQDGSRKVNIEFPYWMEASKVMEIPEARTAVAKVLRQCDGKSFPTEKQAQKCFTDDLCQKIAEQNPAYDAVKMATLSCLEVLRREIKRYLKQNCYEKIVKSPSFEQFVRVKSNEQKQKSFVNDPMPEKVRKYMDNRETRMQMYVWAQEEGLIPSAHRMMQYEQARNHIRHPENVEDIFVDATQVYMDFCSILKTNMKTFSKDFSAENISNCASLNFHLSSLGFVKDIMDEYADPKYVGKREKRKEYYVDIIQKKVASPEEVQGVEDRRDLYNGIAHANSTKDKEEIVMHDHKVFNLEYTLHNRHRGRTRG